MISITKSSLINHILECDDQPKYKEYKQYVVTEFDKWLWNRINRYRPENSDYIETNFSTSTYAQKVYNNNVNLSGKSDTDYGEFIRAFNKLAYRCFNDGDSPICGPYSAIQEFLKCSDYTSRKFEIAFDDFNFNCDELFNNDYDLMNRYAKKFESLLMDSCKGASIFEFDYPHCNEEWCNDFITIIDQLVDEIKGMERCTKSCDDFYKNILEYLHPEIYKWLEKNTNEIQWQADYQDDFVNKSDSIYISVKSNSTFNLKFELGRDKYKYLETKALDIDLEHITNEQGMYVTKLVNSLSKIHNNIQSKHPENEDKNFDLTVDDFFAHLVLQDKHRCDLIKITKNGEKLYDGRILDLFDATILSMKIKDFHNDFTIEVE